MRLSRKGVFLQQAFPRPQVKDLLLGNQIAKEAVDHSDIGIKVQPIPLHRLRAGVVDASSGNSRVFGTILEGGKTEDS